MKHRATIMDFWTGNSKCSRVESVDSVHSVDVELEVSDSEVTESDINDGKSLSIMTVTTYESLDKLLLVVRYEASTVCSRRFPYFKESCHNSNDIWN